MRAESKEEKRKDQLVVVTGFLFLYLLFKESLSLYSSLILGLVFLFIPLITIPLLFGMFVANPLSLTNISSYLCIKPRPLIY
jgi:hypothetical protein